jgi:hypothetical protein
MATSKFFNEYDAIVATIEGYIEGSNEVKRAVFHPGASFFDFAGEQLAIGTPFLFDWIDKNGAAPDIEPRFVSVDVWDSVAVTGWSGACYCTSRRKRHLIRGNRSPRF